MSEDKKRVSSLKDFHSGLETERKQWESLWRDCATYIDPNCDDFGSESERRQGGKKGEKVFDNTAILARDRLAAAHESMLVPRNAKWHSLKATREDLNDDEDVKEYLEAVTARIFAARYRPSANFASQVGAYFQQLDTFGTGGLFIDENVGQGLRYKALHLNELYIGEDFQGRVNRVHRKFTLTASQAVEMQKAGRFTDLPKDIAEAAKSDASRLKRFWFLHCVCPSEDGYGAQRGWRFDGCYMAFDYDQIVGEHGYKTMPFAVGRYVTGPRETYGRAPGMTVLRDIQMLQEMNKTAIREAQRLADPPMFLPAQSGANPFSMRPGSLNWGMIDPQSGKPSVQAFQSNADLSAMLELIQDRRQSVNDAFLVTLFQILLEKPPNMTATEALLRAQEKGVLLAPAMGRQQSEFLGPLIEREIAILADAGEFDDLDMPEQLRGSGIEIAYDAPLNRLQRTDEAVGILRTVEALAEPAKIDPTVYDVFQWDKVARTMADANGAPASVLNTLEEMAAIRAKREQSEQIDQAAVAGPAIAKTVESLTQAQATAQNIPSAIPMVQPA